MRNPDSTDEELVIQAKDGNETALETLLERYKPLILSQAAKYFIKGADRDDVIQEAMIGMFKAVQSFNPNHKIAFAAVAKRSVDSTLIDAIRKAETLKNMPLNNSLPLDEHSSLLEEKIDRALPEDTMMSIEVDLPVKLSALEREILTLRLQDYSYQEIAKRLELTVKSVDNAIQRIRTKCRK